MHNHPSHIPYFDGWRGVAIVCVLIDHFSHLPIGGTGVTIFFALSGLLMTRILLVQRTPLRVFYRRRAARILPVFWLYSLFAFVAWEVLFGYFNAAEVISTLTFTRAYFPDESILHSKYPIGPIWSLNVEEHCYVLLSLLTVPALRYGEWFARWSLALLALLCVAVFVYYKYYPPQAKTLFFMRSEVAALPLLLSCSIYLFMRRNSWKPHSWVPVAGALVTLVTPFLTDSVFLRYLLISGAAAISVNTLHAAPRWLLHSLEQPLLRWLGLCSFSLYLWHQLFFFFYRGEHPLGYTMLAYGGSIALAAASYHGFEKPMRRWLTGASTPRDTSPA